MPELNLTPRMLEIERRIGRHLHADLFHRYVDLNEPLTEIAEHYGCAVSSLARWLREMNVPIRRVGRPPASGRTPITWRST